MEIRYNCEKICFEGKESGVWMPITNGTKTAHLPLRSSVDTYRIEVSLACNLKCKYCIVHMNNVRQLNTVMSIKTASIIADKFNEEVGEKGSIFLMGGEPLVNLPVVKYLIEHTKGSSIIFTNGLALNEELINYFHKHNTYILTSLDGYSLEHNNKRFWPDLRHNFDTVTENIKNAINKDCKVGVSCLLHRDNVEDARDIASFFIKDLGAKSMSFSYPHRTMDSSEEDFFDFEKYTKSLIDVYCVAKKHGVYVDQIGKILSCIAMGNPMIIGCKAGTRQRTFYPDGSETICTKIDTQTGFLLDDYTKKLPYFDKECQNCIAHGLCRGECPWDFFVATQKEECGHRRVCIFNKGIVEYIINDILHDLSKTKTIDEAKTLFKTSFLPLTNNFTF